MRSIAVAIALSSALVSSSSLHIEISINEEVIVEDPSESWLNQHRITDPIDHESTPSVGSLDDQINLDYEIHQGYWTVGHRINEPVIYLSPNLSQGEWKLSQFQQCSVC